MNNGNSSPFRKMRGIPDTTLNEALLNHRDTIAKLVHSVLAQNRWNVGMVGTQLLMLVWLAWVSPRVVTIRMLGAGFALLVLVQVARKVTSIYLGFKAAKEEDA